ncbi:Coenzyme F420 hydrogenase/dehydrogenase, beta subunit C-terminal domain [Clostridium perfringens]|nr:Coenzyme F420 hydrogenase/dehydrogenase, beta subunit C-terminal domain [Clostridium perfringens]
MISIKEKNKCCGCSACVNICPKNAILMKKDKEGFLYPIVDLKKCINCNLCEEVCNFKKNKVESKEKTIVYAAKNIDNKVRDISTSGGIFTALAEFVLMNNGIVFGAAFDKDLNVIHDKIFVKKDIIRMNGSKYVQSDLKSTFKEVEKYLNEKRIVLFSGTPCQVDGLKSYLLRKNINLDMLLLCDIVCHGVPSPKIWNDYLFFLKNKLKMDIIDYKFRDKKQGWHGANIRVTLENGKEIINKEYLKIYTNLYFSHVMTRPSCHNCKYTDIKRNSDITIGDFWGIEKINPKFDDNNGVSLLLIHSEKGKKFFENIKNNITFEKSNTIDCLQPQLEYPTSQSKFRDKFWDDYYLNGFKYIIKSYAGYNFKSICKKYIILNLKKTRLFNYLKK